MVNDMSLELANLFNRSLLATAVGKGEAADPW
jgi:hypothetical protein